MEDIQIEALINNAEYINPIIFKQNNYYDILDYILKFKGIYIERPAVIMITPWGTEYKIHI